MGQGSQGLSLTLGGWHGDGLWGGPECKRTLQIQQGSLPIRAERLGAFFPGRKGMKPAHRPVLPVVGCSLEGAACVRGTAAGSQPCQPCPKSPSASRAVCEPLGAARDALPAPELSPELGAFTLLLGSVHLWSSTAPGGCGCWGRDGGVVLCIPCCDLTGMHPEDAFVLQCHCFLQ